MKVSLNIIKHFLDFDPLENSSVDELVSKINQQLGQVEEVINLGERYKDAVIVKVAECEKHPDADKLSVTKIDDGGKIKDVARDENSLVQVVCGAPNVYKGMFAVWLPPKSTVPASFDDKEPFVLGAREIRGMISNGMLASPHELALSDEHEGILEITKSDLPEQLNFHEETLQSLIGSSFAEIFELDDTIIDIENKMFTHRPDLFGQMGVTREISAIIKGTSAKDESDDDTHFQNPDWYWINPKFESADSLPIEVFNDTPEKSPRFMAVAMKGVKVGPSPLWLQCQLVAMGAKPINNIVDITNMMMLISAQPTHAYDYDKLRGGKVGVRMAKANEKAKLLNGKEYKLTEEDIVIVDGEGVMGLGGVMGGFDSEVTSETKNIVLEVANFDMYTIRKTSMRHGLFTDAVTRFNKGQSPLQTDRVLVKLMDFVQELSGASQGSNVYDEGQAIEQPSVINVQIDFINKRLGLELSADNIKKLLENANFTVEITKKQDIMLRVLVPFWRTDIEIAEDIVEEVGRLYGFGNLPSNLPTRSIKPASQNRSLQIKKYTRDSLAKAGANEVLTHSFVHGDLIDRCGQNVKNAYQISNALSPDLQYYRLSLMPSLLEKVHPNIKAGYDEFALFEMGKTHVVGETQKDGLPRENEVTVLVVTANDKLKKPGSAYYLAKQYLENLFNAPLTYKPVTEQMQKHDIVKPYEANRSAVVYAGKIFVGIVGEFTTQVRKNLKLPKFTAGFEIDTHTLEKFADIVNYQPLPRFPKVSQDITLKVPAELSYQTLQNFIQNELEDNQPDDVLASLNPLGIYQPKDDTSHKNISFRYEIASYKQTLKAEQINQMLDQAANSAKAELSAERI